MNPNIWYNEKKEGNPSINGKLTIGHSLIVWGITIVVMILILSLWR